MGKNLRSLALIIGFLGAALAAYGLFGVISSVICIPGFTDNTCPTPIIPPQLALMLGILLCVGGIVMGGGMILFSALFFGIGLAALAVGALGMLPMMPTFPWIFGILFCLGGLVPLVLGTVMKRSAAAKQAMAAELMRTGMKGTGTIIDVRDTGMTINNNPRVLIRMRIEPTDGSAPVERSKTALVARVAIPRVGERYPAWFDRTDPDKWMYGTGMDATAPAEIKDMFARTQAPATPPSTPPAPPPATAHDPVAELARLSDLWKSGALTDTEFAAAKARLLGQIGR